ncbi:Glutathione S-transferase 1 [Eumeta japonica]|uniref:Glutathione S-transferase 1 n=1 Tax=Eumeta variegata TaxID=151549 RepID=A0A4C1Z8T8_EUMVA|nr:Glutathione S-transferase 1 [Eumeta japonica]
MKTFILHKHNASPPARAVMMLGDILGLKFEFLEPKLLEGELSKPEYSAKNPMKTIPLLEDGDFALADSHAIVMYLISKYGADKRERLYPNDHQERARLHQLLFFDTGILFPSMRAVTIPTFLGQCSGITDEQKTQIENAYGMLEGYLQKSSYVAANHLTLADICVGATATTLHELLPVDADRFPKIVEWMNRINTEEFFKTQNAPGCAQLGEIIRMTWEKRRLNK